MRVLLSRRVKTNGLHDEGYTSARYVGRRGRGRDSAGVSTLLCVTIQGSSSLDICVQL